LKICGIAPAFLSKYGEAGRSVFSIKTDRISQIFNSKSSILLGGFAVKNFKFTSEIEEATDPIALQEHFYASGWTDGLPVVPPTPERVGEFLEASGREPPDIITIIPTRNRAITAEKVAINCVMAGCLPEYMPVVIAVLEAMAEDAYRFHASITSTGGSAQFIVVNGPIRKALSMNSDVNVLGPGNRANSTIGRAVRLIIINVAGAVPGVLDKSTQGHPGKYSFCMAEAEEASPWEPLHVECGFDPSTSTVTVFAAESGHGIQNHLSGDPEELLTCIAREVASIGGFSIGQCALVLSPEHANIIAGGGWDKKGVKKFIFEHAIQTKADLKRYGKLAQEDENFYQREDIGEILTSAGLSADDISKLMERAKLGAEHEGGDETRLLSRGLSPDDILLVVAGGAAGGHSTFIPSWSRTRASIFQTKPIQSLIHTLPLA